MMKNRIFRILISAVLFGAVAGCMILGVLAMGKNTVLGSTDTQTTIENTSSNSESQLKLASSTTASTEASKDSSSTASDSEDKSVAWISQNCMSSIVAITNKSVSEVQSWFGTQQYESSSSGSGIIIGKNDTELLIATNYHVIESAETLTVCFEDSEDAVYEATLKGGDSENDLAVIAVKLKDMKEDVLNKVTIATIADSSSVEVGDQVVAIGNALGYGQSVTTGIISAKDREVAVEENITATLIQTDAAINPGNSGGALFNMKGEVIGINSSKYASEEVEGMGFAIPSATAQPILEELMNRETREKVTSGSGYLGISGRDVSSEVASTYGIPEGAYVNEVTSNGAADKAGIKAGDIITKFDGITINSITSLKSELEYYKAGEKVKVVVQRSENGTYKEVTVTVTLDENTSSTEESSSTQNSEIQTYPEIGGGQNGSIGGASVYYQ